LKQESDRVSIAKGLYQRYVPVCLKVIAASRQVLSELSALRDGIATILVV
jgi:hypothetical protein